MCVNKYIYLKIYTIYIATDTYIKASVACEYF